MDAKTALRATGVIGAHMAKTVLEINYDTRTLSEQAVFETIVNNTYFLSARTVPEELEQVIAEHNVPEQDLEIASDETRHSLNTY